VLDAANAHARLRASGLRLTPQRRAVVDALVGDCSHPTAEEVAARIALTTPGVSLSTVYKVLHELASLGLIRKLEVPGAMRFDPESVAHAHASCDACGRVIDTAIPADALEAIVAAASGEVHDIGQVDVVLHGRCAACAS